MTATEGTGRLVRLILRRDRFVLPTWVVLFSLFPVGTSSSIKNLYPTEPEQMRYYAETASNASYVALFGPAYTWHLGGLVAQRMTDMKAIVGLISLLVVIRHTRAEEEAGRRELLAATRIGRQAQLTAALLVTVVADLVLGVFVALGLLGLGLPAAGSFALGLELSAAGIVFAALGALLAQVSTSARISRGLGIAVLALAYLLRLAGDSRHLHHASFGWLSWLSPLHWVNEVRAYAGERWWLFLVLLAAAGVLAAGAYALSARRDVGAGLLAERLGPPSAAPALAGPVSLAWRMHRGMLVAWSVGFAIAGVFFGGVARDAGRSAGDNDSLRDIIDRVGGGSALSDGFLASLTSIIGLIAAGYAIQTVLRLQGEEVAGRGEPVLATSVPRLRWAGSHLLFTLLGPAVALLCYGLAAGLAYGASSSDVGGQLPRTLAGALVQLPAVWVLGAIAVALFGLLPRITWVTWAVFGLCFLFGQLGAIFKFPQGLLDVSPYTHVPRLPGGSVQALPLVVLTVVAIAVAAAGLAGVRRRDVPA